MSLHETLQREADHGNYEATPEAPNVHGQAAEDGFLAWSRLPGGWLLGLHLRRDRGLYVVDEVTFMAVPQHGGDPFTTSMLRSVPLGETIAKARQLAANTYDVLNDEAAARLEELLWPWKVDARSTSVVRDDLAYSALAARYVQLVAGGSRKPVEQLAKELGVAPVTVSQHLREARQRGVLTATEPGRSGGELTDHAMHVLVRAGVYPRGDES